jgi:replicative DNA helicase
MNPMEIEPKNLQAEQSVLGAIFLDANTLDLIDFLEDRDFSHKPHEVIIQTMRFLRSRQPPIPVDLVTVTSRLQKLENLEDVGSVSYLAELADLVPTAANIKYYADIVRSQAHRRRVVALGPQLAKLANKDFETDEDFFCAVDDIVSDIRPKTVSKMKSFAEMRKDYFVHLKTKAAKLLSGFKDFDDWSQLWLGWLYILAGRPGVGKTAKALQMGYGIAKNNPDAGCVAIYSQEMDEKEVIDRIVCNVAGVNYTRLINKGGEEGFRESEWARINQAYDEVEKMKIFVQDSSGVTIDEMESTARILEKEHGKIACIIIDYLQIMGINEMKGENRASAIGRVTRRAKNMARNRKCVVIMLSQFDRAVDEGEPKMKHLKESGSIEQDADIVEALYHNGDMENGVKIIDSIFLKGRNVGLNRFRYKFEFWYQRFVQYVKKEGGTPENKK